MAQKKYDTRVLRQDDGTFTAEVIRRRTSRGTVAERTKTGFDTHANALTWAQAELQAYLERRTQRRSSAKAGRARQRAFANELAQMSFQAQAKLVHEGTHPRLAHVRDHLRFSMENLWDAYAYEMIVKHGHPDKRGEALANETVGKNWTQRFEKALTGALDGVHAVLREASVHRAQQLVETFRQSQHTASAAARGLLNGVRTLPGTKILTVLVAGEPQVFDLSDTGQVGHAPHHEALLLHALDKGLLDEGVLLVRQFIPGTAETITAPNGRRVTIPWKAMYCVLLDNGTFRGLPAEDVERACSTQPDGSQQAESCVLYKDAIEWLPSGALEANAPPDERPD